MIIKDILQYRLTLILQKEVIRVVKYVLFALTNNLELTHVVLLSSLPPALPLALQLKWKKK